MKVWKIVFLYSLNSVWNWQEWIRSIKVLISYSNELLHVKKVFCDTYFALLSVALQISCQLHMQTLIGLIIQYPCHLKLYNSLHIAPNWPLSGIVLDWNRSASEMIFQCQQLPCLPTSTASRLQGILLRWTNNKRAPIAGAERYDHSQLLASFFWWCFFF